jgi:hypothetical protein
MLSGNININTRLYEDTFPFQVESSAPRLSLYNEITRESTYLVMMPAKSIHTAA